MKKTGEGLLQQGLPLGQTSSGVWCSLRTPTAPTTHVESRSSSRSEQRRCRPVRIFAQQKFLLTVFLGGKNRSKTENPVPSFQDQFTATTLQLDQMLTKRMMSGVPRDPTFRITHDA